MLASAYSLGYPLKRNGYDLWGHSLSDFGLNIKKGRRKK